MTVAYVGATGATSGAGTATASSLTIAFPAGAQAGNVAVLIPQSLSSTVDLASVPSGWTYPNGAVDRNGSNGSSWLLLKQLTSADITAGSVTISFNAAQRCVAEMDVWTGVTGTGVLTATNVDTASNTSEPLPSIANVPAGAVFAWTYAYRSASAQPDVGLVSGYTQGGQTTATTSPFMTVENQYKIVSTAGTYGGETGSSPAAATGVSYAVAIPSSAPPPPPPSHMDVGSVAASALYLGSTTVSAAYVGSTQVWP